MAGGQAFDAARESTFLFDPEDLTILEGDDEPDPMQRARAALPVDPDKVAIIKKIGFPRTILVRKDGNRAVVVDGRQFTKAARVANKELVKAGLPPVKVPCRRVSVDDGTLIAIGIAMNRFHEADNPIVEARALSYYLQRGSTEQDATVIFGRPLSWIRQMRSLLDTHQSVQNAVTAGKISVSAAAELSKVPRTEQAAQLKTLLANAEPGKRATVAATARAVKKSRTGDRSGDGTSAGTAPPAKKQLRALLEADRDVTANLPLRDVLKWVLTGETSGHAILEPLPPKKRGRPPKAKPAEPATTQAAADLFD